MISQPLATDAHPTTTLRFHTAPHPHPCPSPDQVAAGLRGVNKKGYGYGGEDSYFYASNRCVRTPPFFLYTKVGWRVGGRAGGDTEDSFYASQQVGVVQR